MKCNCVYPLRIAPHESVGKLKLGMSPEEILDTIYEMRWEWDSSDGTEVQVAADHSAYGHTMRYQNHDYGSIPFFFMVTYEDDKAVEIGVHRDLAKYEPVELEMFEVLKYPADCTVKYLKRMYACTCDSEDEDLATTFEFPELGLRFWREMPFHQKLLLDDEYMKMMGDGITDMFRYLYFDMLYIS